MILPDPSGQYVVGADAGRDQIFVWKLDANTGKLTEVSVTKSLAGAAPRHFVSRRTARRFTSSRNRTRACSVRLRQGKADRQRRVHLHPAGGFEGSNTTSELLIDKAGKSSLWRQPQS
jgi:6-phosphogluconolactonase (cycloisomerase 2 family)